MKLQTATTDAKRKIIDEYEDKIGDNMIKVNIASDNPWLFVVVERGK